MELPLVPSSQSQRLCTTYRLAVLIVWEGWHNVLPSPPWGRRWLGTTCRKWIAAHIHKSFVERGDKAGAYSMTGRAELGNGGQETAALRPKASAERVMRASSHRGHCPNCHREEGGGVDNNLGGQISCLAIVAELSSLCTNKMHVWRGTMWQ